MRRRCFAASPTGKVALARGSPSAGASRSGLRRLVLRPARRQNSGVGQAAGRGVYLICMAEVSSAPAQWPVSGEQIDSGIASWRPGAVNRHGRLNR
jgi:hypothetical protein